MTGTDILVALGVALLAWLATREIIRSINSYFKGHAHQEAIQEFTQRLNEYLSPADQDLPITMVRKLRKLEEAAENMVTTSEAHVRALGFSSSHMLHWIYEFKLWSRNEMKILKARVEGDNQC